MASARALGDAAEQAGILSGYHAAGSGAWCEPSERALQALLEALEAPGAAPKTDTAASSAGRVARCLAPVEVAGPQPVFGLWLNLYALRGEPDFGVGSLTHLGNVVEWAAAAGAQFVGLSPLHALRNLGDEVSPYGPKSRLFRNSLYLDPLAVPELETSVTARQLLDAPEIEAERAALAGSGTIAYERVAAQQRALLAVLHAEFERVHADGRSARSRAYAAFVARGGELLRDFATFSSLEEHFAKLGLSRDWRSWPPELRERSPAALRAFQEEHAHDLSFHAFLQFELERQLEAVQARARAAGMRIGLYQDLAVGSLASSFDTWRFPDLFVLGASIGAPPDAYAPEGQDWCMPPLHPRVLASDDFAYVRQLLQSNLRHAGALRIDHVMGLFQQYWIPRGLPGSEGAYVRFPARELLGRVAAESRAAGALVIGEDLGTLPRALPLQLARAGLLSSRVLFFERERSGRFRAAKDYSRRALATATTHDLPPLAGLWCERDLEIRRRIGAIPDDAGLATAREEREHTRRALLERLLREGDLGVAERSPSPAQLCRAVHTFLGRSPAPLVGISLDDLAGEVDPVNLPGIPQQRHASWSRRMGTTVEALGRDPDVARTLEAVARARAAAPQPIG